MIVGLLKEIKPNENRVALLPAGVELLIAHGHKVLVEKNAASEVVSLMNFTRKLAEK
jgi:L-alanine dehydrogenase (EC 1.4.1.1)